MTGLGDQTEEESGGRDGASIRPTSVGYLCSLDSASATYYPPGRNPTAMNQIDEDDRHKGGQPP
jgi:hypothetical protein